MTQPAHDKYDPNCPHERTHRDAGGAEICTDCRNIVLKPTHDDKPLCPKSKDRGLHSFKPKIGTQSIQCEWCGETQYIGRPMNPHDDTTEPMTVEQIVHKAIPDDMFLQPYSKREHRAEAITAINALIEQREAAIRKTERRKGIRDGYSYALTEIDIANDYVDAWKRVSAAHKKAVERCHD